MRPLDDNNAGARPIGRGIGRAAHDRGPGSDEIAGRCPFLGGCAPHGRGQRIRLGPAAANARQREDKHSSFTPNAPRRHSGSGFAQAAPMVQFRVAIKQEIAAVP